MIKIIDFCVHSSLVVALSVLSLTVVSYFIFEVSLNSSVLFFVFFSTIIGYNYTKYPHLLFALNSNKEIFYIQILTALSIFISSFFFFELNLKTQFLILAVGIITLFYALSVFNYKSIRNVSGVKIYVVAICWVGITLLLPLVQAERLIDSDVLVKCIQRFLLVIVLILIFEIIDIKEDALSLKTVPQSIGIRNTKILGTVLLGIFFCLEFFLTNYKISQLLINGFLILIISFFMFFANEKRPKYYTTFWVESIPVFWLLLIIFFR